MASERRRSGRFRCSSGSGRRLACALLASILAAACGGSDGDAGGATPTPLATATAVATPAPTPTPGCGNGLVDPGELCDGEEFCSPLCGFVAAACCSVSGASGDGFCVQANLTGANACRTIGGQFSFGAVCSGDPCPGGPIGCSIGSCVNPSIPPTTVCCQQAGDRCDQTTFADLGSLTVYVLFECDPNEGQEAVVGTCDADGRCVPRR